FTNSEPIVARILVRNILDDRALMYKQGYGLTQEFNFTLSPSPTPIATNEAPAEASFADRLKGIRRGSVFYSRCRPGTQHKYSVDLLQQFGSLKPGEYTIQAGLEVPNLDRSKEVEVRTGEAKFKILGPSKPASLPAPKKAK